MQSFKFGVTTQNLPILGYQFGPISEKKVLILGGVHGDETEGVVGTHGLLEKFITNYTLNFSTTIIPTFNLDGVLKNQRKNARNIDLNRNLPTNDWTNNVPEEKYYPGPQANSEPENQALVHFIDTNKVNFIISLHSWKPVLNTNGDCAPISNIISKETGYEIVESIGYPTPGCLGTYSGLERNIPTLTYEIERGLDPQKILNIHVPAIIKALKAYE